MFLHLVSKRNIWECRGINLLLKTFVRDIAIIQFLAALFGWLMGV